MPNFTYNTLTVTGDKLDLQQFKKNARSAQSDLSLNALLPMPAELKDTNAEDEGPNWYSWSIESWGTKWDVDGKLLAAYDDCLEYAFKSAWNPPIAWMKQVSLDYPTLQFSLKYVEESDAFTGIARVRNGQVDDRRIDIGDFGNGKESMLSSFLDAAKGAVDACAKMSHRISSLLPEGR